MRHQVNPLLILLLFLMGGERVARAQQLSIKVTPLVSGVEASFRGLAVSSHQEAWVTGSDGTVIRTEDAGQTWQRIIIPGSEELDFRDVEVLSEGTVLLMSVGKGQSSKILRSVDSGDSWTPVLVNSEAEGFFDGMAFDGDGKSGVLFGDPVQGRLEIFRTSDGGETWDRLPEQQRPKLDKGEYGFAASGTGIVARGRSIWIGTGGSVARVWQSRDDGETWQAHDTPIRCGNESSGIFSIDVIDQRRAVVIGGNYAEPKLDCDNVAFSNDGGMTWGLEPGTSMPHKACVQSLGEGRLLTCGRTGIALSEDAGRTWESISDESYYTLAVDHNSESGFLAGKDGRIARFQVMRSAK